MAKISTIKEAVLICKDANITPFIWGHRGLGKSALVQQVAAENNWGFIDLRCSQLEASDIRGLPDRIDGRTHYLPPADMPIGDMTNEEIMNKLGDVPEEGDIEAERIYANNLLKLQSRFQNGILFIDEVNRAQDDVLQAIFQLVLDRRVGMYALPPGWCVVAAGNFMEGYMVTGFNDPAFLNRFSHLTLSGGETTLEEWVYYMSAAHGEHATNVVEFASQNMKYLDGDVNGELGFSIQPSRRSWDMVVRVDKVVEQKHYNESARIEVLAGLVGRDVSLAYSRHSCPVKPRELIQHGVNQFKTKLSRLSRNELTGLMWGLVSFCKSQTDKDEVVLTCLDFAEFMIGATSDKDVVVAFCRALAAGGGNDKQEKPRAAVISNPRLAQMMSKFGKKAGNSRKSFIDHLVERPALQEILAKVSWGVDDFDADEKPSDKKTKNKK